MGKENEKTKQRKAVNNERDKKTIGYDNGSKPAITTGEKFKRLADANMSDNFMFVQVMREPEILKSFLEIVLKISILDVKLAEYEKTIFPDAYSKGIRLDIYTQSLEESGEVKVFSVEMQQKNEYNVSKRSRYYHSAMDMDLLMKGEEYNALPDSLVIFICLFDPFKKGGQRYTFKRKCSEYTDLSLEDGTTTLVLTDRVGEPEINEFFRYLKNSTDEEAENSGELVKLINKKVQKVRFDPKLEVEYLNFQRLQKEQYDDGYRSGVKDGYRSGIKDGEERGRAEGIAEGRDEMAYMLSWLHEHGRDDDVMRTITDKAFCMDMLEEYRRVISSEGTAI